MIVTLGWGDCRAGTFKMSKIGSGVEKSRILEIPGLVFFYIFKAQQILIDLD